MNKVQNLLRPVEIIALSLTITANQLQMLKIKLYAIHLCNDYAARQIERPTVTYDVIAGYSAVEFCLFSNQINFNVKAELRKLAL